MEHEVLLDVVLLQTPQLLLGLLSEARRRPSCWIANPREEVNPHLLHLLHPLVVRRKHGLRRGEIRGDTAKLGHQLLDGIDLPEGVEPGLLLLHLRPAVAEILKLARRRIDLKGLEESLGPVQLRPQVPVGSFI